MTPRPRLTVEQAARRARTSEQAISDALRSGELRSTETRHVDLWRRSHQAARLTRRSTS